MFRTGFKGFIIFMVFLFPTLLKSMPANHDSIDNQMPVVEVVFCLDLSGSTNGLIDNVREQVWSVVNMIATASPKRKLRIGLVGFSRPSFGGQNNYVKTISKLTDDYDLLVAEMWKIKPQIEKGDQFVSSALEAAGLNMNWSKSKDAVKVLFLIGNGRVDTGSPDYRSVVSTISENDIYLVPVYCLRERKSNEIEGWNQIGRIVNRPIEAIWVLKRDPLIKPAKDEGRLAQWNRDLNRLLISYSKESKEYLNAVITCDNKSMILHPVSYENRLFYRVSEHCLNKLQKWDLAAANLTSASDLLRYDMSLMEDSLQRRTINRIYDGIEKGNESKAILIDKIKKQLPYERQLFLNSIVSKPDFESSQILEKVVLRNVLNACKAKSISFPVE
ncbi:MAG: VWA domain-containing protein [Bacteroidetes bacterium]|nr:VWA domain-containing protein [Bacteroidota bacterium]MBL0070918.1 VWA domain-containing protein [Bacteroidota bacterium]